jgi:hypothetical protein
MQALVQRAVHALFGTRLGAIDYYRFPEIKTRPFNGQRARCELFRAIVHACKPAAIIETGTHRGVTTEYMASAVDVPVFTVELAKRNFGYARAKLRGHRHVHVSRGDSRKFLSRLIRSGRLTEGTVFAYLDAHWWGEELPLADEIAAIFSKLARAVVMIDDFEVPWDGGYGFDDYGPGKALKSDYIQPSIKTFSLVAFGPSTASRDETGARRGCVVLTVAAMATLLDALPLLRRHQPTEA